MRFTQLPQPFVRAEALERGVTARVLDRALGQGGLTRLAPGLYVLPDTWEALPPWEQHLALARTGVRVTPDAVVSHLSAAALLGLPLPPRPPLRATLTLVDDRRTSDRDDWRQFHRGATPPGHVVIRQGHPYLVPARTVIDCGRDLDGGDALAVIDAALGRGLVTGADLVAMRGHQRRWPGIAGVDLLVRFADGRRESWFESRSAFVMGSWGVPQGIPQVVVRDSRGRFVARVDVLWPELGVVGEADGRGKYLLDAKDGTSLEEAAARAVIDESGRESRVRDLGLEVFRWEPSDLFSPLDLLDLFHAALARARPDAVTARFSCSCCQRSLTDCESPTRIAGLRGPGGG